MIPIRRNYVRAQSDFRDTPGSVQCLSTVHHFAPEIHTATHAHVQNKHSHEQAHERERPLLLRSHSSHLVLCTSKARIWMFRVRENGSAAAVSVLRGSNVRNLIALWAKANIGPAGLGPCTQGITRDSCLIQQPGPAIMHATRTASILRREISVIQVATICECRHMHARLRVPMCIGKMHSALHDTRCMTLAGNLNQFSKVCGSVTQVCVDTIVQRDT